MPTQTPEALALGRPNQILVDKEIPWRPRTSSRPTPTEPKLKGIIFGEQVVDESSATEFFRPIAGWNEDVEAATMKQLHESG